MNSRSEKPRWQYRFDNYKRAFFLLQEAIDKDELSQLEKEGTIQRFEYSMELAWKVMGDYLESVNVVFSTRTPRTVIRTAFEAKLIEDGQAWMDALDARNKMSHTYDFKKFEAVIEEIRARYLKAMSDLYIRLMDELI